MTQPIILGESEIESLLESVNIRVVLERMFTSLGNGTAVQPPQTVSLFPNNGGDFITYLGILADEQVFGAKLSPYIPADGKAITTAWTLLMSMQTGAPLLLCDAKKLTTERTAATTIIGVNALAAEDASILTIVGAGPVALAHLRYAEKIRQWREIRIASLNVYSRDIPGKTRNGLTISKSANVNDAASGADVVMLCTSSGVPVVDFKAIRDASVVTSISTNVPNAHEIDPSSLSKFDVYCDYRATTPASAGEMKIASAIGEWSASSVYGDLPELLTGRAKAPSRERPAFFRSIGLGLEDVAAATALLQSLRDNL